jgi:hypothetical protein
VLELLTNWVMQNSHASDCSRQPQTPAAKIRQIILYIKGNCHKNNVPNKQMHVGTQQPQSRSFVPPLKRCNF